MNTVQSKPPVDSKLLGLITLKKGEASVLSGRINRLQIELERSRTQNNIGTLVSSVSCMTQALAVYGQAEELLWRRGPALRLTESDIVAWVLRDLEFAAPLVLQAERGFFDVGFSSAYTDPAERMRQFLEGPKETLRMQQESSLSLQAALSSAAQSKMRDANDEHARTLASLKSIEHLHKTAEQLHDACWRQLARCLSPQGIESVSEAVEERLKLEQAFDVMKAAALLMGRAEALLAQLATVKA